LARSTAYAAPHGIATPVQAPNEASTTKHDAPSGQHGKAATSSHWYVSTTYVDTTPTPATTRWNASASHVYAATASTIWLNTCRGKYRLVNVQAVTVD
jgi:hypothetical protein